MGGYNLVFLGAPGSGKGTQSKELVKSSGYIHVSTGDLLRREIADKTDLGIKVKDIMEGGNLVSNELVLELLKKNVDLSVRKYIFDGFPRNVAQAEALDRELLASTKYKAVYFKIDTDKLVERLVNRRVSTDGLHIYNLLTNPPRVSGICDVTGQSLVQRDDDKEEVVRKRMDIFNKEIQPMIDFYRKKSILCEMNADKSASEITDSLKRLINN